MLGGGARGSAVGAPTSRRSWPCGSVGGRGGTRRPVARSPAPDSASGRPGRPARPPAAEAGGPSGGGTAAGAAAAVPGGRWRSALARGRPAPPGSPGASGPPARPAAGPGSGDGSAAARPVAAARAGRRRWRPVRRAPADWGGQAGRPGAPAVGLVGGTAFGESFEPHRTCRAWREGGVGCWRTRSRFCQDADGNCGPGASDETTPCEAGSCGGWLAWTAWTMCSASCGPGRRSRIRYAHYLTYILQREEAASTGTARADPVKGIRGRWRPVRVGPARRSRSGGPG